MKKRRLLYGSISSRICEITDKENVLADEFASALRRLADDYLQGSVELDIKGTSRGIVTISVSTAAELIRLMLEGIAPDDVLQINIELASELKIELAPRSLPKAEILAKIITLAKSAGFTVSRTKTTVTLTSDIAQTQLLKIYAISQDDIYEQMRDVIIL